MTDEIQSALVEKAKARREKRQSGAATTPAKTTKKPKATKPTNSVNRGQVSLYLDKDLLSEANKAGLGVQLELDTTFKNYYFLEALIKFGLDNLDEVKKVLKKDLKELEM